MKQIYGFGIKADDYEKLNAHIEVICDRIWKALENDYYIEAIALEHQLIEYLLGENLVVIHYLIIKLDMGKDSDVNDMLERDTAYTYARLNDLCLFFGAYDNKMHERLKGFNTERTNAVHKFFTRPREYAELKPSAKMGIAVLKELLSITKARVLRLEAITAPRSHPAPTEGSEHAPNLP